MGLQFCPVYKTSGWVKFRFAVVGFWVWVVGLQGIRVHVGCRLRDLVCRV